MMFLAIELCLAAICVPLALMWPRIGDSWFGRMEGWFSALAQRRALAVVAIGLLALGMRLALLPILPIPQPKLTDEFSYLLQADTFAHGRLANPTHPMWVHFETFQENWKPTYASMYYPGLGMFLAAGQIVLHHPFWGVWFSSGLMCAAICWALQGWLPAGWALLGALLAVIRLGSFSYWADSYWGGTVTALAGALVIGALPRIKKQQCVRDAIALAVGMALLAYTRPYEGLFFCVPVLLALIWWAMATPTPSGQLAVRVLVPFSVVMIVALAGLGYYFYRVTGSPLTTGYQVNIRTYGLVYFPWEKIRPVALRHPEMQMMYSGGPLPVWYDMARHHPLQLQSLKAIVVWLFFFGPIFTLPILAWLVSRGRGRFWKPFSPEMRFLIFLCFITYLSCMLTIYIGQPHYIAHLAPVFYVILMMTMMESYDSGNPSLKFIARAVPVVCLLLLGARTAAPLIHLGPRPSWSRTWCSEDEQNLDRARVLDQLQQASGKHLVIVRYQPGHNFILDEWVYNNAEIDASKVVWARDMGAQNAELTNYFNDRDVWLAEPDYTPPRVSRYEQP
jgi:hypothetical protein